MCTGGFTLLNIGLHSKIYAMSQITLVEPLSTEKIYRLRNECENSLVVSDSAHKVKHSLREQEGNGNIPKASKRMKIFDLYKN